MEKDLDELCIHRRRNVIEWKMTGILQEPKPQTKLEYLPVLLFKDRKRKEHV